MRAIREVEGLNRERFEREIVRSGRPAIFRGLAAGWPAVRAAAQPGGVEAYVAAFGEDAPCEMIVGPPEINGRIFYDADMTGLNFAREPGSVGTLLSRIADAAKLSKPSALAAQSLAAREVLPGFAEDNAIDLVDPAVGPRVWIGNRVVVATHYDVMENIAVVVAGRRRFTLFPPEQACNLYVGPFEFTPAGTPVSLVDAEMPDMARFPRFAAALEQAETADLAPGDAIFIPYMWWHHVRSLDAFNMLVNYWWSTTPPPQPGLAPIDALVHARLAIGDLPERQRAAWRAIFEQAVFNDDSDYIPEARRGLRGPMTNEAKARLRRQLGHVMAR